MAAFKEKLTHYVNAGFPALWIQTHEEQRAEQDVFSVARDLKPPRPVHVWTVTEGWVEVLTPQQITANQQPKKNKISDPVGALRAILPTISANGRPEGGMPEESILLVKDFHPYAASQAGTVQRQFRDMLPQLKATGRLVLFLSPTVNIPNEWEKDLQVLTYSLPDKEQLGKVLDAVVESVGSQKAKVTDRAAIIDAAAGLTVNEAENAFSLALVRHKGFDDESIKTILAEKAQAVRKTGILEYYEVDVDFDSVGGLDLLKSWVLKTGKAFSDKAREFGLRPRKGVLVLGVPGTGKSLLAKATAAAWKRPLLRLDMGRVFGGVVGKSEENMRSALAVAEAIGGILWIDEIEKGVAGMKSSGSLDSGVTARVMGTLLTWMQEHRSQTFVFATANDISKIPPELISRFSDVFAVDIHSERERADIFGIHIKARKRDVKKFDLKRLAKESPEWTGREIEKAVDSALFDSFDAGVEVSTESIAKCLTESKPLSATMPEAITEIRNWVNAGKARPASSDMLGTVAPASTGRRRIASQDPVLSQDA